MLIVLNVVGSIQGKITFQHISI